MVASEEISLSNKSILTKLYSHFSMVVLGKYCFVFEKVQGHSYEVDPFDNTITTSKKVPIVDTAIV